MIHLDVLNNDGHELSLKWRRDVDFKLFQKQKAVRVGPHPIINLTGQGRGQIALNLFNVTDHELLVRVTADFSRLSYHPKYLSSGTCFVACCHRSPRLRLNRWIRI